MIFTKVENNAITTYPYTLRQLKDDNPNTSFPKNPPADLLAEWGVCPVADVPPPPVDHTHNVVERDPVLVDGNWVRNWEAVAASPEEVAQREADAWANLRSARNGKLSDTDWTQVADAPVDQAAWATYRQALRDLPANTVDPFNPVWPVEPT